MNLVQAIVISILQGISELFPVSSLGLAVVALLFAAVKRPVGARVQPSTRSDIQGAGDLHRQ